MKLLNAVTYLLLIIGGLNWGLVGFFDYDLVAQVLGDNSNPSLFVYNLIGFSALYQLIFWPKNHCCSCGGCKK